MESCRVFTKQENSEDQKAEVESLRKEFSLATTEISGLEKKYEILNVLCTELQNTIGYLQSTVKSNLSKLDENGYEINQLYQKLNTTKDENGQMELANNIFHAFIEDLRNRTLGLLSHLILTLAKNENTELKCKFDAMNKNARNKMQICKVLLDSAKEENEEVKMENTNMISELKDIKIELESSNMRNEEHHRNNQALCTEIRELKNDNDNLSKTISKLESTIIQLDGEMTATRGDQAIQSDAKSEINQIETILKSYREQRDCRLRSEGKIHLTIL